MANRETTAMYHSGNLLAHRDVHANSDINATGRQDLAARHKFRLRVSALK